MANGISRTEAALLKSFLLNQVTFKGAVHLVPTFVYFYTPYGMWVVSLFSSNNTDDFLIEDFEMFTGKKM